MRLAFFGRSAPVSQPAAHFIFPSASQFGPEPSGVVGAVLAALAMCATILSSLTACGSAPVAIQRRSKVCIALAQQQLRQRQRNLSGGCGGGSCQQLAAAARRQQRQRRQASGAMVVASAYKGTPEYGWLAAFAQGGWARVRTVSTVVPNCLHVQPKKPRQRQRASR